MSGHPIYLVAMLRRRYGSEIELGFSRYKYKRRVREDERSRFRVPICQVGALWLKQQLNRLSPDEELALESQVRLGQLIRHIPMVDYYGKRPEQLRAITESLPELRFCKPLIYATGRSFHAYFPALITYGDWVKFMGSALLCNTPSNPHVVDQRWIGHRLIGGYAALRWSWNTERYKAMPRRIWRLAKNHGMPS
jgi:hypothetical protein